MQLFAAAAELAAVEAVEDSAAEVPDSHSDSPEEQREHNPFVHHHFGPRRYRSALPALAARFDLDLALEPAPGLSLLMD